MSGIFNDGNAVLKDLTALFEDTRAKFRAPIWPKYATKVSSIGAYEKYAFPTAVPFPRNWKDERVPQGIDVNRIQQVDNERYELSLEFGGPLLQDATAYNGLAQMVQESAASSVQYPDYLMSQALVNSMSPDAIANDGEVFYSTNHRYAGAGDYPINNIVTGTGTSVNNLRNDLQKAIASLRGFKDNAGKLVNQGLREGAQDLFVVCPPSMLYDMRTVLNAAWLPVNISGTAQSAGPAMNVMSGIADVEADGYLTDSNDWFLMYTSTSFRPYVMQERQPLMVKTLDFNSEYYTRTGKVMICTEQRLAVWYLAFYRTIRIVNA